MCDSLWLISAPNEKRISRIISRDKITEDTAKRRISNRNNEETLRAQSHIIINNDGSEIALRSKVETALKAMERKIHGWRDMKVFEL
jgi:dephospho-CoA kinase